MKRFASFLWGIDPGYFRLKHAIKTVLAILLALWWVQDEHLYSILLAGIACGFSMQGIVAKPLRSRFIQVLIFHSFYFSAFMLGLWVRDSADWTGLVLVLLGFAVNYGRRFDLQHSMAPMMAWSICFLATILPFGDTSQAYDNIYGFVVGLIVSAIFILLIFPDNYANLYVRNSNRIFRMLGYGMNQMRRYLIQYNKQFEFRRTPFANFKTDLLRLLDSNQMIEQSEIFGEQQRYVNFILIHEYALCNAFFMITDALQVLWQHDQRLPYRTRVALNHLCRQFNRLFKSVSMKTDYTVHAHHHLIAMQRFTERLSQKPATDPQVVICLLNLKLGFVLLNQHLKKMMEGGDAA